MFRQKTCPIYMETFCYLIIPINYWLTKRMKGQFYGMDQLNIQEEIFKSIETIVTKLLEQSNKTKLVSSIILECKRGLYVVQINGTKYLVKDGIGLSGLSIGTPVWVTVPNGEYKDAFISAKR